MGWRVDCFVLYLYGRSQQDRIEKNTVHYRCIQSHHTFDANLSRISIAKTSVYRERSIVKKKNGEKTKNGNLLNCVEKPKQKHVGHRLSSFHNIQIV